MACRTLKTSVKDELTIPEQVRYVVPIELGRVERLVEHFHHDHFPTLMLLVGV